MAYRLEFSIKGVPKNPNQCKSWRGTMAERRKWRRLTVEQIDYKLRPPSPLTRAKLTLIRATHMKKGDYDNRVSSFKAVIDGLKDAMVIIDDSEEVIGIPEYLKQLVGPKDCHIRVIVEEI